MVVHSKKKKDRLHRADFAQDIMGRNSLQGDDQEKVHNQRHDMPESKSEPDDVMESFEKLDKDKRARTDLGKGMRKSES